VVVVVGTVKGKSEILLGRQGRGGRGEVAEPGRVDGTRNSLPRRSLHAPSAITFTAQAKPLCTSLFWNLLLSLCSSRRNSIFFPPFISSPAFHVITSINRIRIIDFDSAISIDGNASGRNWGELVQSEIQQVRDRL